MAAFFIGFLLCIVATLSLRECWRTRGDRRIGWLIGFGMTAAAASAVLVDRAGLAAGLTTLAILGGLAGLGITWAGAERREPRAARTVRGRVDRIVPPPGRIGRGIARGAAATLATFVASEAFCAALSGVVPGPASTRFAASVALTPIIWALLMVWTLSARRLLRPLVAMAGTSVASGLVIAVGLVR